MMSHWPVVDSESLPIATLGQEEAEGESMEGLQSMILEALRDQENLMILQDLMSGPSPGSEKEATLGGNGPSGSGTGGMVEDPPATRDP